MADLLRSQTRLGFEPEPAWWKVTSLDSGKESFRQKVPWRGLGETRNVQRETESSCIETLPKKELLATAELSDVFYFIICYNTVRVPFWSSELVDDRRIANPSTGRPCFFFPLGLDRSHCTAFLALSTERNLDAADSWCQPPSGFTQGDWAGGKWSVDFPCLNKFKPCLFLINGLMWIFYPISADRQSRHDEYWVQGQRRDCPGIT